MWIARRKSGVALRTTTPAAWTSVLDKDLIDVGVGAQLEGAGDLKLAVAGVLGRHVEHVFDPVHRLFDGVGDRIGDRLRRGARIGGGDRHRGGRDIRILAHRQAWKGDGAHQGDDDGDDDREDRSVHEEVRKLHFTAGTSAAGAAAVGIGSE
jgi:hypothetical protein